MKRKSSQNKIGQLKNKSVIIQVSLFVLYIFCSFAARSQTHPQLVEVDEHLTLLFPDMIQRLDTMGVTVFQTTVQEITCQVIKRENIFQEGYNGDSKTLINQAIDIYNNNPRFKDLGKLKKDTTIGGSRGRYLQMTSPPAKKPYHIFIFVTMQDKTMYSIQMTSFNTEELTYKSLQHFLSNIVFKKN